MNQIKKIKSLSKEDLQRKLRRVKKSFINIPVVTGKNQYPYSFFSLTDFNPPMDPKLMEDMADLLIYFGNFTNIDLIVSEADRGGGPLTQMVALKTDIPYTLANWYPVHAKGAISIKADVGFSGHGVISVFGIKKNQNIILVDDIISS